MSGKQRKQTCILHNYAKFLTLERTKTNFASCQKKTIKFCKLVKKFKPKFASWKKFEMIFAHLLKIIYFFVEKIQNEIKLRLLEFEKQLLNC